MREHTWILRSTVIIAATTLQVVPAAAQSLAARVDGAPPGYVQFTFAARPGVCGNGRTYIQTGPGQITGSFMVSVAETQRAEPCEPGPVRVVLDRADRQIISIRTYVGPPAALDAATDLGRVQPQQAADYLLDLAARAEGRVGRDALLPATLADSANVIQRLVTIARNTALPRETRSGALSHVARSSEQLQTVPPGVLDALLAIARDEADNQTVRKNALSALARLEHGAGVPPLIELARQPSNLWLAREATNVLAGSGDPRVRAYLRTAAQREDQNEELRAIALRALGRQYATQQDAALLRSIYPRLTTERSREAVVAAVADVGGAENAKWLLDLAKNQEITVTARRKALDNAVRAGVPISDLVALYNTTTDYQVKEALVTLYARSGERVAVDALMSIARTETNVNVRRRAVTALSSMDDPRVKDLLRDLIVRQ